jgi:hypothetical protein
MTPERHDHLHNLGHGHRDSHEAANVPSTGFPPAGTGPIDWGRYAEVMAYDHSAGIIYLETEATRK